MDTARRFSDWYNIIDDLKIFWDLRQNKKQEKSNPPRKSHEEMMAQRAINLKLRLEKVDKWRELLPLAQGAKSEAKAGVDLLAQAKEWYLAKISAIKNIRANGGFNRELDAEMFFHSLNYTYGNDPTGTKAERVIEILTSAMEEGVLPSKYLETRCESYLAGASSRIQEKLLGQIDLWLKNIETYDNTMREALSLEQILGLRGTPESGGDLIHYLCLLEAGKDHYFNDAVSGLCIAFKYYAKDLEEIISLKKQGI